MLAKFGPRFLPYELLPSSLQEYNVPMKTISIFQNGNDLPLSTIGILKMWAQVGLTEDAVWVLICNHQAIAVNLGYKF